MKQVVINLFLRNGPTKDASVCALVMKMIWDILGCTKERCPPPMAIFGDEEIHVFLRDLRIADPERRSLIRDLHGD